MAKEQWTMQKVAQESRSALVVWLALTRLGDQAMTPILNTSREIIAAEAGLKAKDMHAISRAISVLRDAGWVETTYSFKRAPDGSSFRTFTIFLQTTEMNMYRGMFAPLGVRCLKTGRPHIGETIKNEEEVVEEVKQWRDIPPNLKPERPSLIDVPLPTEPAAMKQRLCDLVTLVKMLDANYGALCTLEYNPVQTAPLQTNIGEWCTTLRGHIVDLEAILKVKSDRPAPKKVAVAPESEVRVSPGLTPPEDPALLQSDAQTRKALFGK